MAMTWGTTGDFHHKKEKKDKNKNNKKHDSAKSPSSFSFSFLLWVIVQFFLLLRIQMKNRGKTTAHDYGFIISASHDPVSVFFFEKKSSMMTENRKRGQRLPHGCGSLQTNHWMVFDGNFRGLRWSTKGVMNEWRSGRIFSLITCFF